MHLSDFDYHLPPEFIAQKPLDKRDDSKLMVLNRANQTIEHHQFFELPDLLDENSVLVFNESRVIPARLKFKMRNGIAELLLIKKRNSPLESWECMVRPGKRFKPGNSIKIDERCTAHIKKITPHGLRIIEFEVDDFNKYLKFEGEMPTPPYVKEELSDNNKYQTIYAKNEGSVAAPTAGFHFTEETFKKLKEKGIQTEFVTLHVGLGTFQPVKMDAIEDHNMHSEWFSLTENTAKRLNEAKKTGKKIIAVGTTSIRVLESCADTKIVAKQSSLIARSGETNIFIYPGYKWKFVDQLITNFHVPKSTLLMLVSSFASPLSFRALAEKSQLDGREFILKAYEKAKKNNYRFFSFGDSMWIQ